MKLWIVIPLLLVGVGLVGGGLWLWTPDKPRATLESRYLRAPEDLIEVAGVRLHVRDEGPRDRPPVVMLHGFGSSLHTWEAWATTLQPDYRVVRFDMPGAGLSGPDPTGDYSDPRSVAILAAVMDRLGIASATLIGNSMGGKFAWNFAVRQPERVEKLVLISPDGFASPGVEYGKRQTMPAALKLMRYALPKAMLRMNLEPAYADRSRLSDAVVTRYYDLTLAPGVREAMLARLEQVELPDPVPLLRTIRAPTLLLWGEKDRMIPIGNAQDYLAAMPNARLVVLPGLGHVPHEEAPEAGLVALRGFLGER